MSKKENNQNVLHKWQEKYEKAKAKYAPAIDTFEEHSKLYKGTNEIAGKQNKTKPAASVRNIVAELVDSQTDSNIPSPKVTARKKEDETLAQTIESWLRGELDRLPFEYLNDQDERATPIMGSDFLLVEWDSSKSTHTALGSIAVTRLSPKQVIPQPGVTEIENMDYLFVTLSKTSGEIWRKYKIDLSEIGGDKQENNELITQVIVFYRGENGVIGRYSWVVDEVLEDFPDYYARRLSRCKNCGQTGQNECKFCKSKAFETTEETEETLEEDVVKPDGTVMAAEKPVFDPITGMMTNEPLRVTYYKPDQFPVLMRRNISAPDEFLGDSDVGRIKDQQNNIKIADTKIKEKLTYGGSFVTLPKGLQVVLENGEMKVLRVDNPQQKALIDTVNLQANVNDDVQYARENYETARQMIGITDSFQGRKDPTATSGKAKEFSAAQTAGRLESKRVMKAAFYAEIFEMMFKLQLAFADQPVMVVSRDTLGRAEYGQFNRYDFLEIDAAGEAYWNDNFLFSVDTSAPLATNREAMWQETRMNLESGAFGNPSQLETLVLFWAKMELLHYPGAEGTKKHLQKLLEEQKAATLAQTPPQMSPQTPENLSPLAGQINGLNENTANNVPITGGGLNALPTMSN